VSCHGSGEEQEHTSDSGESNECDETLGESIETALVAFDDFEDFWTAYPRRENKKKAHTAWARLTKDKKRLAIGVASIMSDLVAKGVTELRFVPLPTTFIHGQRWEDWRDGIPASWCPANGNGKAAAARAEHDAFLRQFAADRGLDYEPGDS